MIYKGISKDFYEISMIFPCDSYGNPVAFLWDVRDVSMLFLWDYFGIQKGFLWDFRGIPLGFS